MGIYSMRNNFSKYGKPLLYAIAFIFVAGIVLQFGGFNKNPNKHKTGSEVVIAEVNGNKITQDEFNQLYMLTDRVFENPERFGVFLPQNMYGVVSQFMQTGKPSSPLQHADLRSAVFSNLVQNRLMQVGAAGMGVKIDDKEIKKAVEEKITDYLKAQRRQLVTVDEKREKIDPRKDKEYINRLKEINFPIKAQEEFARNSIIISDVAAGLAFKGVEEKILDGMKEITDKDVMDSFNTYSYRQVVFLKPPNTPEEQIKNKAKKFVEEVKAGGDFAALAKSATKDLPFQQEGELQQASFPIYMKELSDALTTMKPGEVSDIIETENGIYVVKLESVAQTLPEKFDDKAKKERREEIKNFRKQSELMKFYETLRDNQNVVVKNKEFNGYWLINQSMMARDAKEREDKLKNAAAAFKQAITEDPDNLFAVAKLAQLRSNEGNHKEVIDLLLPILEGDNPRAEGADLRMLLGEAFEKTGKLDEAIEQFMIASDMARYDSNIHHQLLEKFKALNKPELVAKEELWIKNFNERIAEIQKQQQEAEARKNARSEKKDKNEKPAENKPSEAPADTNQ
ncbi:MAG: peptidylprolyl isomerase [Armatimonadota bacterium]